ncbi:hypothetical protein GF339_01640 [candidate division KSB3 bacterium]|uniref:SsuA/THI5-like domain-containing protein n=1 Tax=candidate division KSB3 bacterium TaxID=2044937 RepID=A0A9D5JS45_9BACT|nr:hypothetical protein [candidate division KSB3 bacterium]MBD3323253.1 hypothetical protein [candidate division KSB3 bacterium]
MNMSEKPRYMVLLCWILLWSLIGWGSLPLAAAAQPEPAKLKVLLLPHLSFAPFFIAQEEGYFAEQGLDIEFVRMAKIDQAVPSLARGELDVITGDLRASIFNAIARGSQIRIVADKGHIGSETECAYVGVLARRALVESGALDDPSMLRGRKMFMNPLSSSAYYMEKMLATGGLTLDDVIVQTGLRGPVYAEALQTGALDLSASAQPWLTRILQMGHAVLYMPANEVIPGFQHAAIYYGPNLLQDNPDLGQRFMIAYLQAVRQYNQGKTPRNIDIIATATTIEPQLVEDACWAAIHSDGHINAQSVLEFQQWILDKAALDQIVTEDLFWDGRFIEHANQELAPLQK